MSESGRPNLDTRKTEVQRRLTLAAVVEPHVKLSGSAGRSRRRGQCPFHGSTSASLALFDADKGTGGAYCFGCQWQGDVFAFQQAIRGIGFMDALAELEAIAGIAEGGERVSGAGPVQRERNPSSHRRRDMIEPIDMARWIWRQAVPDLGAVRRYFLGRGVPERALTDARLAPFRYLADCPCTPWAQDDARDWRKPPARGVPIAPAVMALVCRPTPPVLEAGEVRELDHLDWIPTGLHVTYLNPGGDGTMVRRKPWAKADDPDPWLPKRRMLGPVGGGAIVLGAYRADAHLFVGEGNETVLSAIGLAGAQVAEGDSAVGIATLSLDNLQGRPKLWKSGVWPLHAIEPDPERRCFTIPGHRGPVTGLVDSDMKPLRGRRLADDAFEGEAVVERKGGPIVSRAITGAERARICGELVVKGWRAAGVGVVSAVRAPAGMDFNDAAREMVE